MPFIFPILVVIGLALTAPELPPLHSPQELATWSKCKRANIADYLGRLEYKEQGHDWMSAERVMWQRWGDCKGKALIARDTLLACGYPEARILTVKGFGTYHAITVFMDKNGRRGYINGFYTDSFEPGTPWEDVVWEVEGGPWRVVGTEGVVGGTVEVR